jgi:hypothetical protein
MSGLGYVSIKLPLKPLKKMIIRGLRGTFAVVDGIGADLPKYVNKRAGVAPLVEIRQLWCS